MKYFGSHLSKKILRNNVVISITMNIEDIKLSHSGYDIEKRYFDYLQK